MMSLAGCKPRGGKIDYMPASRYMQRALALASRATGDTSPNPLVGAVIVAHGKIVGEGYHHRAGAPHAERQALKAAGTRARSATMYVTLEPCAHQGKTPPCTPALIAAGVARVVVALEDPDKNVRGKGIEQLRRAGIAVEVGDRADQARELNRAYLKQRVTGRPFVTLKIAQTADGYMARAKDERTRITGARSARFTRQLRIENDAVMVGVDTVIIDDPLLTVRPPKRRAVPYVRIVVDSHGRTPLTARVVRTARRTRTIVATTRAMPHAKRRQLKACGVEVLMCDADRAGRVDLDDLLVKLGRRGTLSVLCEGGPRLARALLTAGRVDRVHRLIAPKTFGAGITGAAVAAPIIKRARVIAVRRLGRDSLITAAPENGTSSQDLSRISARSSASRRIKADAVSSSAARR